jgi:hypothetical protein
LDFEADHRYSGGLSSGVYAGKRLTVSQYFWVLMQAFVALA